MTDKYVWCMKIEGYLAREACLANQTNPQVKCPTKCPERAGKKRKN